MKSFILLLALVLESMLVSAQSIKGKVTNKKGQPLERASVQLSGENKSVLTDANGEFVLATAKIENLMLVVSFVGYKSDTLILQDFGYINIVLTENTNLGDVEVSSKKRGSYIASNPIKTEVISSFELKKAACCDLAGCFETQSTVHPQTTNVITNAKELRILGLSGIYNQVLIDGFPQIQALTYTYGISSMPGPLVENIFVAKGANSVLQGFESISGQINVLTKEPENSDPFFLNAYLNSFGEKHVNAMMAFKKKKWSSLSTLHVVLPARRVDRDEDDFLDVTQLTRLLFNQRWKKGDEKKWGWSTQFNLRYLNEQRVGGQTHFRFETDKGTTNAYGQVVNINQPEVWYKTAYKLNETHRFVLQASGLYQHQDSYFGVIGYGAKQTSGYANLQYEWSYGNNQNTLKSGLSYRHLSLRENIQFYNNNLPRTYNGQYDKKEQMPGIFTENTMYLAKDKLVWILGLRADKHNHFDWQFTPRTLLKYSPVPNTTLRASMGKGWRTANIFSENIGMMVSSRNIVFTETLLPERALNYGFNITHNIKQAKAEWYFSVDYYHTRFYNQIFPDYDTNPLIAVIKNFSGKSISNGLQAEVNGTFSNLFSAKVGYIYLDVFQAIGGRKISLPFNAKHRLNGSASFMPLHKKWHLDVNFHWSGKQRLPDTKNNPLPYQRPDFSNAYAVFNVQYTYTFKQMEWYAGIENLFDFRQLQPIMSWQNPFGQYFDTQFVWGPTRGRELYIGVRYRRK